MDVPFSIPDALPDQTVRDLLCTLAAEIGVKHPADDLGLLRYDLQFSAIDQPVAIGRLCGDELTPFHPPAIALPSVLGDGD